MTQPSNPARRIHQLRPSVARRTGPGFQNRQGAWLGSHFSSPNSSNKRQNRSSPPRLGQVMQCV
ncbi:hypothetical protein BKA80DRAFT_276745 [Phyllosticta citrichinensis]